MSFRPERDSLGEVNVPDEEHAFPVRVTGLQHRQQVDELDALCAQEVDHEAARSLFEESMGIWQELGDRWGYRFGLMNLGLLSQEQGDAENGGCLTVPLHELGYSSAD